MPIYTLCELCFSAGKVVAPMRYPPTQIPLAPWIMDIDQNEH